MYNRVMFLDSNYKNRVEIMSTQTSIDRAGYDVCLKKNDLYIRYFINYDSIHNYQLQQELFITAAASLCMRDTLGLDIQTLGIDEDHGNGD